PAAARREDAGGLRRQHRDDGRRPRAAGAAREVQGPRDSQGQAVRRPEGVGLRLRRAARRRAGPAARAVPQRQRLHHRHARAQRMPVDSQLVAYQRAAALDSLNATAWENIARLYQQKGDTLKAIGAFIHELQGEPQNTQLRLGIAELLRLQKQYQQAVNLLDEGLARNAADQKMSELRLRICLEGELWRCVVDGF